MASIALVEMGETALSRSAEEQLQACGLGACVGLCLYGSGRIALLVHVVLPQTLPPSPLAGRQRGPRRPANVRIRPWFMPWPRYPAWGQDAGRAGGSGRRRTDFTALGSDMTAPSRLEIGTRNVLALQEELIRAGVSLCAEETGRACRTNSDAGSGDRRCLGASGRSWRTLLVTLGRRTAVCRPAARGGLRIWALKSQISRRGSGRPGASGARPAGPAGRRAAGDADCG